jgi:hypothetical protein
MYNRFPIVLVVFGFGLIFGWPMKEQPVIDFSACTQGYSKRFI